MRRHFDNLLTYFFGVTCSKRPERLPFIEEHQMTLHT